MLNRKANYGIKCVFEMATVDDKGEEYRLEVCVRRLCR